MIGAVTKPGHKTQNRFCDQNGGGVVMYRCELWLNVVAKDGIATISKEVDLPFLPKQGDHIGFKESESDEEYYEETVGNEHLRYIHVDGRTDRSRFIVQCQSVCRDDGDLCDCALPNGCCFIKFQLRRYIADGWKVEELK